LIYLTIFLNEGVAFSTLREHINDTGDSTGQMEMKMEKTTAEKVAELSSYGQSVYATVLECVEISPLSRKEILLIVALVKETINSRCVKKVQKSCD
jgi:hypothetical protein